MKKYTELDVTITPGILTGISHLDNLLSVDTGFQSAVIFLTGTSGAGKTTLSKVIQKNLISTPSALYERETSRNSVAKQTRRVVIKHDNAMIADETDYKTFSDFMTKIENDDIKFIIIDSLQTAAMDFEAEGMGENEAQLKVLITLMDWKKRTGGTAILIGMVKKDGDFSGVNKIKHLADCHLHLVFDEKKNVRFLYTTKNRDNSTSKLYYEFVNTEEVIVFYTEKEFELKDKKYKFADYLLQMVAGFISGVDKKHPNYKELKAEYNEQLMILSKSGKSKLEITIDVARMLDELSKKYSL